MYVCMYYFFTDYIAIYIDFVAVLYYRRRLYFYKEKLGNLSNKKFFVVGGKKREESSSTHFQNLQVGGKANGIKTPLV
jgi:hypothetical protein